MPKTAQAATGNLLH